MADIIRAHDDDWSLVREIRLRSLSTDPAAFGQSWEKESTYDDAVWRQRVEDAAWFLAVEDGQPLAVVAVRHEADSPENERELQAMCGSPRPPARPGSPSASPRRSSPGPRRTAPTR